MTSKTDIDEFLTLEQLETASKCVYDSNLLRKTPMLLNVGNMFDLPNNINLNLKLENMQVNGSFKLRGVVNQIESLRKSKNLNKLVTFSAGNYGKAFSFMCSMWNLNGKVLLPDTANESRIKFIQSFGVETEKMPTSKLLESVEEHEKNGWYCLHPFDDLDLIAGYASIAFEILENVDPDIVLVGCGGGGLVSAISCGLNLLGSKAVVYGVEPETANTMYQSLQQGKPITYPASKSVAAGLAPPLTGSNTYKYCKRFTQGGIVLVTDEEIKEACRLLFEKGLKVEPSGCAALAALLKNKIPELNNTDSLKKVVVVLSGGNISIEELYNLLK